jgi:hypothetical protein
VVVAKSYSLGLYDSLRGRAFQLFPKEFELFGIEIGEDFAININDRRERLAGKFEHFVAGGAIGGDVESLEGDLPFLKPVDGFVTPSAEWFDKQAHLVRFHTRNFHPDGSQVEQV